jgi:hypothetical protein
MNIFALFEVEYLVNCGFCLIEFYCSNLITKSAEYVMSRNTKADSRVFGGIQFEFGLRKVVFEYFS